MGRRPCCSKEGLNRGAWTAQEDRILADYIKAHGEGRWRNLPRKAGLRRCGKSCRLRWLNYLRPDIKRGNISPDEEELIIRLHKLLGNRWSLIAGRLPGRTDNEIKNYWNTTLGKKHQVDHAAGEKTKLPIDSDSPLPSQPKINDAEPLVVRTRTFKFSKQVFLNVPRPETPEQFNPNRISSEAPDHHMNTPVGPDPGHEDDGRLPSLTNSEDNNIPAGSLLDFHIGDMCFPDLLYRAEFSASPARACSLDHQPGMMFYEEAGPNVGFDMHPFASLDFYDGGDQWLR